MYKINVSSIYLEHLWDRRKNITQLMYHHSLFYWHKLHWYWKSWIWEGNTKRMGVLIWGEYNSSPQLSSYVIFWFYLSNPLWNAITPNHFSNISHWAAFPWWDPPAVRRHLAETAPGEAASLSYLRVHQGGLAWMAAQEPREEFYLFLLKCILFWPFSQGGLWVEGNINFTLLITSPSERK